MVAGPALTAPSTCVLEHFALKPKRQYDVAISLHCFYFRLCSYYNLSKFNEKFERAYVMQAKEDVRWLRREKEYLDNERQLMAGVPGWVVGKRRYFTQWEDKPDRDVLDLRKAGPW